MSILTMRIYILALGIAVALAVTAAPSTALSTNNPQWHRCEKGAAGTKFKDSACGEALEAGEFGEVALESGSREITAKANGTQELTVGEASIACKKLSLAAGAKVTGAGPHSLSGAEATIRDEECEAVGKPSCEINKAKGGAATITTKALKAIEAYASKEAAEKEEAKFVTLLEPKELTEGKPVYAAIEFSGSCSLPGKVNVEGEVALESLSESKHVKAIELSATPLTKVYVNQEGKSAEKVVKKNVPLKGGSSIALGNEAFWWQNHP